MGEPKETHIVEIPEVDEQEKRQKQLCVISAAIENHPLSEISGSPGHLLLLKLWQREEELSGKKTAAKETRMESARREVFQLSCFFVVFHAVFLTTLFAASSPERRHDGRCGKWWVPGLLSGWASAAFVGLAHTRLVRFWKAGRAVQRERSEGRALTRLVQELRMKGSSFDLSKDPSFGGKKRMKSSSVEIKWRPVDFCSRYLVTICLVSFSALLVPASKLILCVI